MKLIFLSLVFQTLLGLGTSAVLADHNPQHIVCQQVSRVDPACETKEDRIFGDGGLISKGVNLLIFVAGAVAVVIIIISGLMYVLSSGDPQNTARAKDALIYAVVGLVIALIARLVVNFIISRL